MKVIYLFIISSLCCVNCRKYDIEEECMKLYGEELQSVLLRFRRTPEYLDILKDKVDEVKNDRGSVFSQLVHHYRKKMDLAIKEHLGMDKEKDALRSMFGNDIELSSYLRQGGEEDPNITTTTTTLTPIQILDKYSKTRQKWPVSDTNNFKNVGFEFAGRALHAFLKVMDGNRVEEKSTLMMSEGDSPGKNETTTKKHVKDHKVTPGLRMHTSSPKLQKHTSKPGLRMHTSSPELPKHTSKPKLRMHTSSPELPKHTSKPKLRMHTSSPELQKHTSKPESKKHTSSPEMRKHTSGPEKRKHTSSPELPKRTSKPKSKKHTSSPELRKHTSTPRKRKHTSSPGLRKHTSSPRKRKHISSPRKRKHISSPRLRKHTSSPGLRKHTRSLD